MFQILLLEAGLEEPQITEVPAFTSALWGSNLDWNFVSEPEDKACGSRGGRCLLSLGKVNFKSNFCMTVCKEKVILHHSE